MELDQQRIRRLVYQSKRSVKHECYGNLLRSKPLEGSIQVLHSETTGESALHRQGGMHVVVQIAH